VAALLPGITTPSVGAGRVYLELAVAGGGGRASHVEAEGAAVASAPQLLAAAEVEGAVDAQGCGVAAEPQVLAAPAVPLADWPAVAEPLDGRPQESAADTAVTLEDTGGIGSDEAAGAGGSVGRLEGGGAEAGAAAVVVPAATGAGPLLRTHCGACLTSMGAGPPATSPTLRQSARLRSRAPE
jgi:hypothetical protein